LAGFCEHLATLVLWPEPPEWDVALRFRRWAFESAALDLALRQAGRSLHDVLGLEPQPVRFANSLGLGKEPSIELVRRRLARSPGVRFKLDAEATRAPSLVDEVAATGAVDTLDFTGRYGFEVKDPEPLGALCDHVLAAFPDAYLEDPHDLPEIAQRLGDYLERVSYDSPIRSAENIGATPLAARVVNVKPSRIGSLRALFEVYARCARERRPTYTVVAWASWAWAAGRSSCSPRCFTPTRPTTWRRAPTTRTTRRAACRPARWRRAPKPPASAGRRRRGPLRAAHIVPVCHRGGACPHP
jgi:hypothetical protein